MNTVLFLTLAAVAGSRADSFVEDTYLWAAVDALNHRLSVDGWIESDTLEILFEEAVGIAFSPEFSDQINDLRSVAFAHHTFHGRDSYRDRAAPAITIHFMGESDNIGVNVLHFLLRSPAGSEARSFFDLATDGFYILGKNPIPGTAEPAVWIERGGSSAEGIPDPASALEWLGIWEALSAELDGYFLSVAQTTMEALRDLLPDKTEEAHHRVCDNPFVGHVRTALNSFLTGGREGLSGNAELLRELEGLRGYLSQRLAVLAVNDSPMGGVVILLLPCGTPDRVLRAWVYRTGTGGLELRGFSTDGNYSAEDAEALGERYGEFLEDERYSI